MSTAILRSRQALVDRIQERGLTERQLALQAGLGHSTVNHLASGLRIRCQNQTARAIESALGLDRGTLFRDSVTGR